ncbi:hypothetical protein CAEBREN_15612 [Caenorhabditis brenneri]|uniref:Sdz-33 F-box domain-containing protein n=1 Tax=Caenorhabditis brenneri TaxID=135651 RepID=G0N0F7_CAEBE|nr:hypothetical protein CAEBREN_15612 [Caenorhabditis brenneri]
MYWGMGAYGRKKKLTAPHTVFVEVSNHLDDSEDISSELKKRNFTMQDWHDHLQQIFHFRTIDSIWFGENSSEFDIDDIKEVFRNATQVKIENTGCYDFNQLILQKYFPIEKLEIKSSNFRNSKIPKNILMENFTELYIHDREEETTSMKLNEMLLINSKKIVIDSSHMSGQQLNKFLKLWMKGATPLMEHLSIHYNVEKYFDNEIIMNGIEHRVIPRNTRRKFKVATIRNRKNYIFPVWDMYVWFDRCVV